MRTQDEASVLIMKIGHEVRDALGYTKQVPWHTGWEAIEVWEHPTFVPDKKAKAAFDRHIRHNNRFFSKRIVIAPRGLVIYDPEFAAWIEVDSTYNNWIVYTQGRIVDFEAILKPLFHDKRKAIAEVYPAWKKDLERRRTQFVKRWDGPTSSTASTSPVPPPEPKNDSSIQTDSPKMPTFGDLSLLAKPSSRKRLPQSHS